MKFGGPCRVTSTECTYTVYQLLLEINMLLMVNEMVMEWAILKAFRIHRLKTFPEYLAMPARPIPCGCAMPMAMPVGLHPTSRLGIPYGI